MQWRPAYHCVGSRLLQMRLTRWKLWQPLITIRKNAVLKPGSIGWISSAPWISRHHHGLPGIRLILGLAWPLGIFQLDSYPCSNWILHRVCFFPPWLFLLLFPSHLQNPCPRFRFIRFYACAQPVVNVNECILCIALWLLWRNCLGSSLSADV